jgi:hypothetical protein
MCRDTGVIRLEKAFAEQAACTNQRSNALPVSVTVTLTGLIYVLSTKKEFVKVKCSNMENSSKQKLLLALHDDIFIVHAVKQHIG